MNAKRKPVYTVEGEVAMISGALTLAMDETRTLAQRRVLIKNARDRANRLWKRIAEATLKSSS